VRVRELARTLFKADQVAEFFVCGPGDMIDQVSGVLRDLNVPADRIHSEHFRDESATREIGETTAGGVGGGAAVVASGAAVHVGDAESPADDRSPGIGGRSGMAMSAASSGSASDGASANVADIAQVTVLMDGRRRNFTMKMNDDTVLDAAARAGLELPFSCRAGVCSTCRTKVISGEVEMEQNYALEDWELEQGYVLACQSRCKTPTLELDYDEK
jgi:ring-1,2-phenylacetyl-CoA epoxidase subunit PaaE